MKDWSPKNSNLTLADVKKVLRELEVEGLIYDSGERRLGADGQMHIVWKSTELLPVDKLN